MKKNKIYKSAYFRLIVIFCLITIMFIFIGIFYYRYEAQRIKDHKYEDISAIARLKADSIQDWRKQRLADVKRVSVGPLVRKELARLVRQPANPGAKTALQIQLHINRKDGIYADALFLDTKGNIMLSDNPEAIPVEKSTLNAIETAIKNRKEVLSDFFRGPKDIYIDAVAPVPDNSGRPMAIAILRSRAEDFLYPLIQTWPTPSRTAETVLVRRDGESILFLNELRHRSNTALNLRFPVNTDTLPAAQAVSGKYGRFIGRDYRGVEVLSMLQPVPESPWFVVTKVDAEEILAEVKYRTWVITVIIALLIVISAGLIKNIYQKRQEIERKLAEERLKAALADLERSNKDLEQFAYVASHDLQEPLRMVSSYTQLLAERYQGQLDEKAQKFINYAVDGAIRMQTLINDLLAYSRIGTKSRPKELADMNILLGQAISNLTVMIEENRAIIINDDLPAVQVDADQFVQVFQNLINNAVKFRGNDTPRIFVSAKDNGPEWIFSVKDNGIGINQKYADRIFVIFQRLHARQNYPGNGIGLAICKKIVERHNGRIWFESETGKGTTFFFTIPKEADRDVRRHFHESN
jgi:signal transduction histidine kinase